MNNERFDVAILQNLQDGKQYYLDNTYHIIGRSDSCNIVIKDPTLSRQHARIWFENNGWYILDCNSSNGVKVDGRKIYPDEPYPLYDDTEIILASGVRFRFWCSQFHDDSTITSKEAVFPSQKVLNSRDPGDMKETTIWSNTKLYVYGQDAFKRNYWPCVLIALLQSIGTGMLVFWLEGGTLFSIIHDKPSDDLIFIILSALMVLLRIFVFNPLNVGCSRFFVQNCDYDPSFTEAFWAFRGRYLSVVKEMFIRDVHLLVWLLIFVVPFVALLVLTDNDALCLLALPLIILYVMKCYDYRLIPYLLAMEKPQEDRDILQISTERIFGHRKQIFILDLLFLIWYLIGAITMGILYVFYVNPFKYSTNAQIFSQLRKSFH